MTFRRLFGCTVLLLAFSKTGFSQSKTINLITIDSTVLKADSILANSPNVLNFFVSEDQKIFKDSLKTEQLEITPICSIIMENNTFPLLIVLHCKRNVSFSYYKNILNSLKNCRQKIFDRKSQKLYSVPFSLLDQEKRTTIKDKFSITLYDKTF